MALAGKGLTGAGVDAKRPKLQEIIPGGRVPIRHYEELTLGLRFASTPGIIRGGLGAYRDGTLQHAALLGIQQDPYREVGTVLQAEFAVDLVEVFLNCPLRQVQFISDFLIEFCLADEIHNLLFSRR